MAAFHVFAIFCLAALFLEAGAVTKSCGDWGCLFIGNVGFPNYCASSQKVINTDASCNVQSLFACCPTSACCVDPPAPTCTFTSLTGAGCCTTYQSMCDSGSNSYTSIRSLDGSYARRCTSTTTNCPPNYNSQVVGGQGYCIAANCRTALGFDCTRCQSCFPGFTFVADGSCQPPPTIQGSIYNVAVPNAAMCDTVPFNISTNIGQNFATVTLTLSVQSSGKTSGTGVDVTIDGRCNYPNGTQFGQAFGSGTGISVTGSVNLGTTVLNCTAVDSNGFSATCLKTIVVVDNEPPLVTCTSVDVFTGPSRSFSLFTWPTTLATASDNVRLLGTVCRGGPANNSFPVGPTNITCWAWDARFNSTCSYIVNSIDNASPNITCPASTSINTTAGQPFGLTTFAVRAADNVAVTTGPTCTASNTTQFGVGSNLVTCTASDASNPAVSCSFRVNVTDVERPQISCPAPLQLTTSPISQTSISASGTLTITASDNFFLNTLTCGPQAVLLSGNQLASTATITNIFTLGTTNITCTATDLQGNSRSCSTSVVVRDATPPVVLCSNTILNTITNTNFSTLNGFYSVSASDNVAVFNTTCTPSNATQFPFGTTPVTCTARDTAGNTATCNLNVTVEDHQQPTVQCPLTALAFATSLVTNITVTIPRLNASDNVRIASTSIVMTENQLAATTRTLPGNTTNITISQQWPVLLTFMATDTSGNMAACSFGVTVFSIGEAPDNTPPVIINCPVGSNFSSIPLSDFNAPMYANARLYNLTTLPGQRFNTLTWPTLNATDNSGFVAAGYLEWSPNPATAQSGLAAGQYVVAYGATDRRGNSAYCAFRIQVLDLEAPTWLRTSSNQLYDTNNNPGAYATSWPQGGLYAVDNVGVPVPEGACTSVPPGYCPTTAGQAPAVMFPVGTVQFTYTAVDSSGNWAVPARFNVTVRDTGAPTIPGCSVFDPPKFVTVSTSPGTSTADITRLCPLLSPTDNIGVTSLRYSSAPTSGLNCSTPIPFGDITIITAVAYDAAGLGSDGCNIVVLVRDDELPVLSGCSTTAPVVLAVNNTPGLATGQVTLPSISATDNVAVVNLSSTPGGYVGGQTYTFGNRLSQITFTARDTTNQVSCTLQVFVSDTEAPVIHNYPGAAGTTTYSLTLATDPGQPTASYTIPALYATDNVEVVSAGFDLVGYAPGQQRALPIGVTSLRYTAADSNFNRATVVLVLTVVDTEKPVFSGCPSANASQPTTLYYNTSAGQATRQVSWNISVADNSQRRVLTYQSSQPIGYSKDSLFPIGTTTMTFTATDSSQQTNECIFHIAVQDFEPPTMSCPDNFTIVVAASELNSAVTWRDPAVTDNSNQIDELVSNINPGNYTFGLHTVVYTARDPSANTATCSFSFSVTQAVLNEAPSSGASAGAMIAGGAGGGIALIALLVLLALFLMRRNHNKKMQAASSGYAELMAMSDEFVLERARAIQQALIDQRASDPPAAVNAQFIHPTRKFAPPPTNLADLEEYIRETVRKEIARDSLVFGSELGAGEFGAVFRGEFTATDIESGSTDTKTVAIKMLKNSTSDEDKVRFLKEAAIMAQFSHPNIVSLVGVCTLPNTEPTLIVLEYMHLGALHGYLQSPMVKDQLETLTMLRMALDIGSAMQYLAEAGFVHRDLAARNVLLDENMNCRVGDFGLSVDLASSSESEGGIYSGDEGAKIPVRWASIEAICFRQYSSASDVWSYGVLLWEIWSYAELPYKGWNNKKVTEQVCEGYRLPKPAHCPDEVYRIMIDCWNKNVKRRITFNKINTTLVQAWKDVAKEQFGGEGTENGNLYDTGDDDAAAPAKPTSTRAGSAGALYDVGDDEGAVKPLAAGKRGEALYDVGDDDTGPVKAAAPRKAIEALYDTGDDGLGAPSTQVSGRTRAAPAASVLLDLSEDVGGNSSDVAGYLVLNEDD